MGAPRSPKHKFSDSHSSLSSYASSTLQSGCHSRISSMSTVGGHQPFTAMLNDMPSFETKLAEHQQLNASDGPPLSPRTAIPASFLTSPMAEDAPSDPARPHSPSDAILITRGAGSNRSSPTDAMRYVLSSLVHASHTLFFYPRMDQLRFMALRSYPPYHRYCSGVNEWCHMGQGCLQFSIHLQVKCLECYFCVPPDYTDHASGAGDALSIHLLPRGDLIQAFMAPTISFRCQELEYA